jgi:integrase/recombinase XerD
MLGDLVKTFLMDVTARNLSPKTVVFYTDTLKPFIKFINSKDVSSIEQVTAPMIREYMNVCSQTLNQGGVGARMRSCRALFGFLEREEIIEVNPFKKIKLPKVKQEIQKSLTVDEFKVLSQTALMGTNPIRDLAILTVLFDSGIRASELCGLDLDDLSRDKGFILIREAKGGKHRFCPISRETQKILTKYVNRERPQTKQKALFLTRQKEPVTYDSLKGLLKRLFDRANLPYKSPHCWRRGFATQFLKNSGDVFTLQKILGHTTITMSQRYVMLANHDVLEVHQKASPVSRSR